LFVQRPNFSAQQLKIKLVANEGEEIKKRSLSSTSVEEFGYYPSPLPTGWDSSPLQGYPQHSIRLPL